MNENQDVRWLVSESARPYLVDVQASILDHENILRITKRLRRDMSPPRAALILEMAQLRIRARRKFERADAMFFTRRSLEQASGEFIADYKAQRFKSNESLADICCGIGGDLMSLAKQTKAAGIDQDPVMAILAMANLDVHGLPGVVRQMEFQAVDRADYSAFHFDPNRRNHGRKTIGDLLQPSLPSILEWIPDNAPVAIKVAPATPQHRDMSDVAELEWIGDSRECKQQVIWLGGAEQVAGGRTATMVRGASFYQYGPLVGSQKIPQVIADHVQEFVYEPHPALLASGLTDALATEHDLARLSVNVAYLTGPSELDLPMLTKFRVIDVLPMEVKKTARELERLNAGPVEFKKRSVNTVYYDAFQRIKTKGTEPFVVILSPTVGESVAIIAKRMRNSIHE